MAKSKPKAGCRLKISRRIWRNPFPAVKKIEAVNAKRILEEHYLGCDGLTRGRTEAGVLRAGQCGEVLHHLVFRQAPPRKITALMFGFRGKRYFKSAEESLSADGSWRSFFALTRNSQPLAAELGRIEGGEKGAPRSGSGDTSWIYFRFRFNPAVFRPGDDLGLCIQFKDTWRLPRVAARYLIPLFLLDEAGNCYVEEPAPLPVTGAKAVKLYADLPSIVHGPPLQIRVSALDGMGNLDTSFHGQLVVTLGETETRGEMRNGLCRTELPEVPQDGLHKAAVRAEPAGLKAWSNYFMADRAGKYNRLVWGDIHGHSILSDGTGEYDEHYAYARDVRFMDAAALTDHDNQIIENGSWPYIQEKARQWTEPGRFVVLPGYEWAQPYQAERNYGHKNIYFPTCANNPLLSGDTADETGAETPEKLYAKLAGTDCAIISHHPAYKSWMWTDWDHFGADCEEVIEIYSTHGASDEIDTIKPLPDFHPERFVFKNLRERPEIKLGFAGGSDCHAGLLALDFHPDLAAPEERRMFKKFRGGLTAFYVEDLTAGEIFQALKRRRTYATTGEKLLLLVELNGQPAFSPEIPGGEKPRLKIIFGGSAPARRLEIYKNAAPCHAAENLAEKFIYEWQDETGSGPACYFVRVTQEDDQIAWSAVVWTS